MKRSEPGTIGQAFRDRRARPPVARISVRYVLLALASGLVSLVAMGLPWSPMSCKVVPLAWSWHPLVLGPWLSAALVSALLLRARLIENPRVSPWVAGALHALVSAMLFAFLFVGLERLFQGRVGFGMALQEALYSIAYGLLAVVLSSYIAVPVGMLFVRCVRSAATGGTRRVDADALAP